LTHERDVREAYSAHAAELYGFAVRSLADPGRALRASPAELFAGGEARPGFHAQADQAIERIEG